MIFCLLIIYCFAELLFGYSIQKITMIFFDFGTEKHYEFILFIYLFYLLMFIFVCVRFFFIVSLWICRRINFTVNCD